jgi:hypothetical protein
MEVPFGKSWVVPVASLISIALVILMAHFSILLDNVRIMLFFLFGLLVSVPGFLRYLICRRWSPVEAIIKESRDLSSPYVHWRGVSMAMCHEADIEYRVDGEIISSTIKSSKPFNKTINIYYSPHNPRIFTRYNGLRWDGTIFIIIVIIGVLMLFTVK